jgi:uncharacterized membrane protein YsdA (DUF1294 family)
MNKGILYLSITVFGAIGAYLPVILFHQDGLSAASMLGGVVGGIFGIWVAYKYENGF